MGNIININTPVDKKVYQKMVIKKLQLDVRTWKEFLRKLSEEWGV